jgi:hypothetical protein
LPLAIHATSSSLLCTSSTAAQLKAFSDRLGRENSLILFSPEAADDRCRFSPHRLEF